MEYSSCVWDPYTQNNVTKIERIQRRAARWVTNQYNYETSTTDILKKLNWTPLEERRAKNKVLIFQKARHGKIEIPIDDVHINNNNTRSQGTTFRIPHSRTNAHLHSFYPSTIRLFNSLPGVLINVTNPDLLKDKLKTVTLRSHYLTNSADRSGSI